ncbi:MAG: serine hydrolase [Chitinophagales bacterium]
MNLQACLTICSAAFLMSTCKLSTTGPDLLKEQIIEELSRQPGSFAVAFKDLTNGNMVLINELESFHAASTMKTPVMIELFRQAAAGKFSLTDSLIIRNEFRSIVDSSTYHLSPDDDSELDLYKHEGEKRSILDLMRLMITVSSNLATNLLIEFAGPKNVNLAMQELGAKGILVLRGVEDDKAYQRGLNNQITAAGLMVIYEKMAKDELISPSTSEEMINILLDQHFREIIPAQLPSGVKVAHKTGWFKSVNHDSGIVILPDGRKYVLILLSKNIPNDKEAIKALANISGLIYKFMERVEE